MSSVNDNLDPLLNDPLLFDSLDPSDPNSIMYDPKLAEKNAAAVVVPNGKVVADVPIEVSDSSLNQSTTSDNSRVAESGAEEQRKHDVGRQLRRFGHVDDFNHQHN